VLDLTALENTPPAPTDAIVAALEGPAPCDDCRKRMRCAAERVACQAFAWYVAGCIEERWRQAPRAPSRQQFRALFSATDSIRSASRREVEGIRAEMLRY